MSEIHELFERLKKEKGLACEFQPPSGRASRAIGLCSLLGHQVRLYEERAGTIAFRYAAPGAADPDIERARTGARSAEEAILWADLFLRERASASLRGDRRPPLPHKLKQGAATIGDAYDYIRAYFRRYYPREKQWREILRALLLTEQVWTRERLYAGLSGSDIATYVGIRTEQGMVLPEGFSKRPRLGPCKLATAVNDLLMISALFKRLQAEVVAGTRAMPFKDNPFAWLVVPDVEKSLRDKPTAERFEVLMRFVDRVDPSGQLRLAIVIARWLGRRIGAISTLAREDLRLTNVDMLETIRLISRRGHQPHDGVQSTAFAHEFRRGGIFFDRDRDKKRFQRLVPQSTVIRDEVDLYLERNPNLSPSGPLFPSELDPRSPTSVPEFIKRLHAAEALARAAGYEREVPPLFASAFHGYRGLRASELENNQHRPAHVAFLVGWSCKMGNAKDDRYVMHDPRLLYAAVEGLRPVQIEAEYQQAVADSEAEKAHLREQNAELERRLASAEDQNASLHAKMEHMSAQLEQIFSRLQAK